MEDMNNVSTNEIVEAAEEINVIPEESDGNNLIALGVGAAVCVAAGVAALIYKKRSKLEAKQVERLRKKGYTIYEPESVEDCDAVHLVEAEDIDE